MPKKTKIPVPRKIDEIVAEITRALQDGEITCEDMHKLTIALNLAEISPRYII